MCEDTPPLKLPKCVEWCPNGALIYEEREEEVQEQQSPLGEVEIGVESMIEKYGLQKVLETVAKLARP
jgi:benzoyl-CoA reductase subunit BamC